MYEGVSVGYTGDTVGMLAFNTSMAGYQEIITDKTNAGMIVTMTYPLIGNVGICDTDGESDKPQAYGLVMRDYTEVPSNWKCDRTLRDFLTANNVVAISGIDTRAVTRKIRNDGIQPAGISRNKPTEEMFIALQGFTPEAVTAMASTTKPYEIKGGVKKVAILDLGMNKSFFELIKSYGYTIKVFPHLTRAEDINAYSADGVIISDGPGNPKKLPDVVENVKKIKGQKIMAGFGMGHLVMALANGSDTTIHQYGHHDANIPVKDLKNGKVFITTQNHKFEVIADSVKTGKVSHINWNDKGIEGIDYGEAAYSIQYVPTIRKSMCADENVMTKFVKRIGK